MAIQISHISMVLLRNIRRVNISFKFSSMPIIDFEKKGHSSPLTEDFPHEIFLGLVSLNF